MILAIGGVAAVLTLLWRKPAAPPARISLPNPNGYADFLRAGQIATTTTSDYRTMSQEELRALLTRNAEALQLVRAGLGKECRVPIEFSTNYLDRHLVELSAIKNVGRLLSMAGRLAELENRPTDAAERYLDTIRLGQDSARGGLLIDSLVGLALESMGLGPLEKLSHDLDAQNCRKMIIAIENIETKSERPAEIFEREAAFFHQGALGQRILIMLTFRSFNPGKAAQQKFLSKFNAEQKRRRQLALDLASRAYALENGKPPNNVEVLVPSYLKAIPVDPDTGTPLKF